MENGESNIARKFEGLEVNNPINVSNNDELNQVMKAVIAAEATIKQQVEENIRLRSELQRKDEELGKYKSGDMNDQNTLADRYDDYVNEFHTADRKIVGFANQVHVMGNGDINSRTDMSNSVALQKDLMRNGTDQSNHTDIENFFACNQAGHKQDLVAKIQEHEEEIIQLKKHLMEYSVKDAQINNEKSVLEKRISYMRMAFDQQQQDLVDAASKAISYRQDIMEENVRLTYALQAAQQERSTFVSSLMPLLVEYSLQPPVADAQSIVSNVKVLFRHLQEQLLVTGEKLKDSQYQLAPWRSDVNLLTFVRSPVDPIEIKNGLELVTQPTYSNEKTPSSDHQTTDGDLLTRPQSELTDVKNFGHDDMRSYPPLSRRNMTPQEEYSQLGSNQAELQPVRNNEEIINKKVTFGDFVRNEIDEPDTSGDQSKASTQQPINLDDPNQYSPYLPPVLEEPSSSYSEAADDDPPPGIEGLQISGEAFPGSQLQACGYSINGTTSCNFEWVRHSEDGSFNYIDGAKQPNYLITADDIDTYLAIEVSPLDDRKRKGELVKVFANEHRKITCHHEMQTCIEKTLYRGHASYSLSLSTTEFLDIWEPATLSIKRDSYTIKCSGPSGVLVTEKFMSSTFVSIPYGSPTEFSIVDSQGNERILKAENSTTDISNSRDTIVLTLRLFIIKAGEKKKGKKRGLFFNK